MLKILFMFKNLIIVLALICSSFVGCQEKKQGYDIDLNAEQFEDRISAGNAYLLDVRTPGEVSEGVIEGAVVMDVLDDSFLEQFKMIPKDKTIYIYCKVGGRSKKTAKFLKEQGYDSIYHLDGGIKAWVKADKKIVKKQ